MKLYKPLRKQSFKLKERVSILCESYQLKEAKDEETGKPLINQVTGEPIIYLEGVAITFGKPTRNRVSYTAQSGIATKDSLVMKPFLDTHNDSSIRTHPPFGHVETVWEGINPKNGLPCLFYRVNIDPEEKVFIRKARRHDITGVSIQVLVDDVRELEDDYGTFLEATIREYLELSAVLIPGDGDTSISMGEKSLAERFHVMSKKNMKELTTDNGEAIIRPDGVFPKRKVMGEADGEEEEKPLMVLDKEQKIYNEPEDIPEKDEFPRYYGQRETEVAFQGCNCPSCGTQMLKDNFENGFRLRCYACDYAINNCKEVA